MAEEIEYEVKPMVITGTDQFNSMTEELLSNWSDFKRLEKRMKLLDASVKKYMLETGMEFHKCIYGSLNMVTQTRRVLDKSLVKDIESFKVNTKVKMLFKSVN